MRRRDRGTYDDLSTAKIIEVFPKFDIASCLILPTLAIMSKPRIGPDFTIGWVFGPW